MYIQIVGIIAGIFTAASMMPQLIKTFKTKEAEQISIGMLLILIFGIAMWVYYGTLKRDFPIIITNSFSLLVNISLIVLRVRYKK